MNESIIVVFDVISSIAFGVASLFALRIPRNIMDQPSKIFFGLCMGIYVFVGISNIFQHGQITDYLDLYEDYVEILFLPFFLFFIYSVITRQELNKRNMAEKELQQKGIFLESVFDAIQDGITVRDLEFNLVQVNRWMEKKYESEMPLLGKKCYEVFQKKQTICPWCPALPAMKTGKSQRQVVPYPSADDPTGWLELSAFPLKNTEGKITGCIENVRDITKQKKAEEILEESEEKYRSLIESANDAIFVADVETGIILDTNKRAEELIGIPAEKIIGMHQSQLHPKEKAEYYRKIFKGHIQKEKTISGEDIFVCNKDGREIPVNISASVIKIKGRKVIQGFFRDITERKKAEEEKKKLEYQLRQAQKMEAVGRLAGGIAHDFNNILTAIIGYSNIIQMKISEDDPLRADVDQILGASQRAAQLTQSLLAFSRQQIIHPKPVRLNEIIVNAEKLLLRLIGEDIEFKTNLTDMDLTIMADSGQIEQVLINLATNARDAIPEGGMLSISTELVELDSYFIKAHGYNVKAGRYCLISVADTGIGMDENTRKRIFEPFFTTKGLGRGTGLGLSIIYGIVTQHNGFVDVYSKPGKGTTFKIYLPIIKSAIEETKAQILPPPRGGTETVLVAEDDEVVRTIIKAILDRFGYKIIEAVDGEDAVNRFKENKDKINIIILDVVMPKKDGKMVYDEIKKLRPEIKAIFTSGYTTDFIDKKGILEEGVNFIQKPVSANELLRKIREVLDK